MTQPPDFDAPAMLAVLRDHDVEFVVVGGYAANLHGASRVTTDLDACPATDLENLGRLAAALRELSAGIRVDELPEGLPFDTSAEALRGVKMLNLRTPHGDLDLTFVPAGTGGYPDLIGRAEPRRIGPIEILVASLDDVIRSKEAAARTKDLEALPELHRLAAQRPE